MEGGALPYYPTSALLEPNPLHLYSELSPLSQVSVDTIAVVGGGVRANPPQT